MTIQQRTSVQAYINLFRKYNRQANVGEDLQVEMFLRGLKKTVRIFTELSDPKTLLEACKAAQRADRVLYQRTYDKGATGTSGPTDMNLNNVDIFEDVLNAYHANMENKVKAQGN